MSVSLADLADGCDNGTRGYLFHVNSFPKLCFMHCVWGAGNASTSDRPSVPVPSRVSVLHEQSHITATFFDHVTDLTWLSPMLDKQKELDINCRESFMHCVGIVAPTALAFTAPSYTNEAGTVK